MGTNSFHLVVVKADARGRFTVVDALKEEVRLLSGSGNFNVVSEEAQARAVAALGRLKTVADKRGAELRLVATSATREAVNSEAFLRKIEKTTGLAVEVISGQEEGRLTYLGVLSSLPVKERKLVMVDIGGGSTEILLGEGGRPLYVQSVRLGHLRLWEKFFAAPAALPENEGQPVPPEAVEECRRFIRATLADGGVKEELQTLARQGHSFEIAVGSSGTIEGVEEMVAHANALEAAEGEGAEGARDADGDPLRERVIRAAELDRVVESVTTKNRSQRKKLPGIPEQRVDLIISGAVLLQEIFALLRIREMRVSAYALREGLVIDSLSRMLPDYEPAEDIRQESVMQLAERFDEPAESRLRSAKHSARLLQQLVKGLKPDSAEECQLPAPAAGVEEDRREGATPAPGASDGPAEAADSFLESAGACGLLDEESVLLAWAAVLLHYSGMFVSHKGYHKHGYYVVTNTDTLLGFTPVQVEVIGRLVRYHRKKFPSNKRVQELPREARASFPLLCALVRVAVALDRSNTAKSVQGVSVLLEDGSCLLVVHPLVDNEGAVADISLELWAARQELDFFGRALGMPVQLVEGPSLPEATEDVPPAEDASATGGGGGGPLPGQVGGEPDAWQDAQMKVVEARRVLTENSSDRS
jgi:exopolyphosphatase/pppGpp-phosphohydrolase